MLFRNILVPVDFSDCSEKAIRKAIELSEPANSVIALLYITRPLFSLNIFSSTGYLITPATELLFESEIREKVKEYEVLAANNSSNVQFKTIISETGKIQNNIEKAASLFDPDLIIICKTKSLWPFFSNVICPGRIAKKTNCPVLTIQQGSSGVGVRNIVLPVTFKVPFRKLDMAISLAKKFNANIHLMTFPDFGPGENNMEKAFIDSYYNIKKNTSLIIKHGALKGQDIARAILSYSKSINADIILANPQTESNVHLITGNRHISDLLPKDSSIQVLDVEPYAYK
jgi:nucleotide-binding universal stress UspA family protein